MPVSRRSVASSSAIQERPASALLRKVVEFAVKAALNQSPFGDFEWWIVHQGGVNLRPDIVQFAHAFFKRLQRLFGAALKGACGVQGLG